MAPHYTIWDTIVDKIGDRRLIWKLRSQFRASRRGKLQQLKQAIIQAGIDADVRLGSELRFVFTGRIQGCYKVFPDAMAAIKTATH